jgi:uncharacterized protein YkwD
MTRARIVALLAALACLAVVPATATAAPSPAAQMLKKVNRYRAAHGVKKVHFNRSLSRSAARYSRYMMRHGYFGHASRIHASRRFHTLGEIIEIHRGLRAGVRTAFQAWVHSPPHRSVMLMSQFKFAGAGFVSGRFNGHRDTIWTMHFGRR